MKKYKITVLICLILVVSLLITLVIVSTVNKDDTTLPTWGQNTPDYITGKSSIGTIKRTVKCEGKAAVDYTYCDTYTFTDKNKEDLLVKTEDVILPGISFFEGDDIKNKNLGRVEEIIASENSIKVIVSNFEHLQCQLKIPQEKACDIVIGQEAEITFNGEVFHGIVREKDYILSDDGFLNIIVAIDKNSSIIVNASIVVDVILDRKDNVLIIPNDALITEGNSYFADVLNDNDTVERKEIAIGIIGNKYVEVKSGLSEGEILLIHQYE